MNGLCANKKTPQKLKTTKRHLNQEEAQYEPISAHCKAISTNHWCVTSPSLKTAAKDLLYMKVSTVFTVVLALSTCYCMTETMIFALCDTLRLVLSVQCVM